MGSLGGWCLSRGGPQLGAGLRENDQVTMGRADRQSDLFDDVVRFCEGSLPASSIYGFLARERDRLFPDELFDDLFSERGRASVPPSVVATVMVLQRLDGLSDQEAVDRYAFDVRWRYAAGVSGYGGGGWGSFAHTVLVDMRARLRRSKRPNRIFEVGLEAAHAAGLVGRRRVLDSTPLYDAVATMDTVTLIRSAVRGLLAAAEGDLAAALRAALSSGDDYVGNGKPQIDWDDRTAREELIDSRTRDGFAVLALLDGRELADAVEQAAALLATVLGQDLEQGPDTVFRIARRVAKDRVISTVDPDTRHGHKTSARGFDGYKGHAAVDPDSEIITTTTVTPGDASVAEDLVADLLDGGQAGQAEPQPVEPSAGRNRGRPAGVRLWRQRLRHRAVPRPARPGRDRGPLQDPDTHRGGRVVQQGPVRHRPRRRRCDLPGRGHRADPPGPRRRRHRLLRVGLPRVPAARAVHHRRRWAHGIRWPLRADPHRRPHPADQPGLGRRLPRHPPQGRAQARPSRTPQTQRTTSPGPRHPPRRRRLPTPGRRGEPRTTGRPRPARIRHRMHCSPLTSTNRTAISKPIEPSADTSAPTVQLNRTQVRSRPIQEPTRTASRADHTPKPNRWTPAT